MGLGDERVGRIDHRRLGRAGEELGWVGHEVLVESVLAGDEDDESVVGAATGPARLLAERRDRPRKGGKDGGIEPADIDPELEGARRHDAGELTGEEAPLGLPALRRKVSGPIRGDSVGEVGGEPLPGPAVDELGPLPVPGEDDGGDAGRDEVDEGVGRHGESRSAEGVVGFEERRVAESDPPPSPP